MSSTTSITQMRGGERTRQRELEAGEVLGGFTDPRSQDLLQRIPDNASGQLSTPKSPWVPERVFSVSPDTLRDLMAGTSGLKSANAAYLRYNPEPLAGGREFLL